MLRAAEDEARIRRQTMGTPHLLLGLVRDEHGAAALVLESMGFPIGQVRYEAARKVGPIKDRERRRRLRPPYSPRAEAILSQAVDEARRNGRPQVGPEDLLVAVIAEPEGKAADVFGRLRARSEGVPASF